MSNSFCSFSECLNSINIFFQLCIYNLSLLENLNKTNLYQPFGLTRIIPLAYFINAFITMTMLINNIVFNFISVFKKVEKIDTYYWMLSI